MLKEFNILATTSRGYEKYARSELRFLFEKIGDASPAIERTGVSGLIAVKTNMDTIEAIRQLRALLQQSPYEFRFTLRIIPIEKIVPTELEMIQQAVTELSSKIDEKETFRVTVEKRFTTTHSKEIIEKVAVSIKRKVNLTNPDKIVLIEIIGSITGVSVLNPQDIVSVQKEKLL
ncbi:MAG: THUMP domain-containing protein [Candidatus Bathyarchaeia archaeon]|jgi:tRNA acetyltransferase TAN1